jgi:endonuclease YncB( thermonuclease family)
MKSTAHAAPYPYKVLRVIDGDTVEIEATFLPKELGSKLHVRVLGVDTPEKGFLAKCPQENELSLKAKDFTHDKIASAKEVLIDIKKWDKYGGRVLGDIFIDGKSLTNLLIENNFGVPYYGKKKVKDWCK